LLEIFKIDSSLLFYLPLLLEEISNADIDMLPSFEERNNFVFIGNFLHEPNWNAVQYLKETIWPLIKTIITSGCFKCLWRLSITKCCNSIILRKVLLKGPRR
jgi:hypothetical protein